MAFVENFIASQTIGLPSVITLTDTSSGSDILIISRKVAIVNAQGEYITASGITTAAAYTTWAYADATISIDCLDVDTAPNITVYWLNSIGATLYSKTTLYAFTLYGLEGSFQLTQALSAAPMTIQDTNYWMNRMILRCNIDDADLAVSIGGNIYIAQAALERETYLLANQTIYF